MADPFSKRQSISGLLVAWQETADQDALETLVVATAPLMERTARVVLGRCGIADASAVDDAVSLVLDHLRRLAGVSESERPVACFIPRTLGNDDSGEAYLVWLTTERTRDVVRTRRNRDRRMKTFSDVAACGSRLPGLRGDITSAVVETSHGDRCDGVEEMLTHLDPSLASVIRLLLAGNSQKTIAAMLGVCEGTVSRLRSRAIARLRDLVQTG